MAFLNDSDKNRIRAAIEAAEAGTSGELVTVIAGASDDYHFLPTMWVALAALLVPLPLLYAPLDLTADTIYLAQLAVFLVLFAAVQWQPLRLALVPKRVKHHRASRLAKEQFLDQGLHHTEGRTGVLVFVSVGERYVEILADQGINDRVAADAWDGIVAEFVASIRAGRVADGFVGAVTACGDLLQTHFPADLDDRNELPDHLVEL